jgi:hypothetical protein
MPRIKKQLENSDSLEIDRNKIMSEVMQNLEAKNILETEVKRLCSVFDVESKTRVAVLKGLPQETFYHLPYRVWSKVSKRYQANLDLMYKHYKEFGAYNAHTGIDYYKILKSEWYQEFGEWAKQKGFYWY